MKPDEVSELRNELWQLFKRLHIKPLVSETEFNTSFFGILNKYNKEYLTCQDCGTQDRTVRETHCPYAYEINDEEKEVTLCQDCYSNRCQEI